MTNVSLSPRYPFMWRKVISMRTGGRPSTRRTVTWMFSYVNARRAAGLFPVIPVSCKIKASSTRCRSWSKRISGEVYRVLNNLNSFSARIMGFSFLSVTKSNSTVKRCNTWSSVSANDLVDNKGSIIAAIPHSFES